MLKLEQQVCSLELAKRLKELNVKQESFFIWKQCINKQLACYQIPTVSTHKNVDNDDEIIASAFTASELGEMLPDRIKIEGDSLLSWLVCEKLGDAYWVKYYRHMGDCTLREYADTEADARAKMLIYLLENKLK